MEKKMDNHMETVVTYTFYRDNCQYCHPRFFKQPNQFYKESRTNILVTIRRFCMALGTRCYVGEVMEYG